MWQRDEVSRSAQFVIHAALDMVDIKQWTAATTCVACFAPIARVFSVDTCDCMSVYVCVCVRARVCVRVCACACVCARVYSQLGIVDSFGPCNVSAFLSPSNVRFMVMYDGVKPEDGMRHFFADVHALYLKVRLLRSSVSCRVAAAGVTAWRCLCPWRQMLLNPFFKPHGKIESAEFDARVRSLAKKYLGARDA